MALNAIPERQNEAEQIKLLRARRHVYAQAHQLMVLQLIFTLLVPTLSAIAAIFIPEVRPMVSLVALVFTVLDVMIFDRTQRALLKVGAKLQEMFDCYVLELPWDDFMVRTKVPPEDIHRDASSRLKAGKKDELENWYPVAAGEVALPLGRIICQRSALSYDSRLRRHYSRVVLGVALTLPILMLLVGMLANLPFQEYLGVFLPPIAPITLWASREFIRQREAADQLDDLRGQAEGLWAQTLAGQCDDATCLGRSREFQGAIYARRATSPLIFPFIYDLMRDGLEEEMNEGAERLVAQANAAALAKVGA